MSVQTIPSNILCRIFDPATGTIHLDSPLTLTAKQPLSDQEVLNLAYDSTNNVLKTA